jgi:hypothetical protein
MPNVAPDPRTTAPSVPIAIAVVMSSVLEGMHELSFIKYENVHKPTEVNGTNQSYLPCDVTPSGYPRRKSRMFLRSHFR